MTQSSMSFLNLIVSNQSDRSHDSHELHTKGIKGERDGIRKIFPRKAAFEMTWGDG